MTPTGVGTLLLVFLFTAEVSLAAVCSFSGDELNVTAETECDLSADVTSTELIITVGGTINVAVTSITITCKSFEIKAGGKVVVQPLATSGQGTGNNDGSGGGYGGRGGSPADRFLSSTDSVAYGSLEAPTDPGSPGGGNGAGKGGGAIRITASTDVIIDGILSADGGDATSGGGGGSGGSAFIDANTIKGYGTISTRGGNGATDGGGGGGGKITLKQKDNTFTFQGRTKADGGLGGGTEVRLETSSMASSSADSSYPNNYGKLDHSSSKSWRPTSSKDAYLEMRLDADYYVTAVQTKGGGNSGYH
ncbi:hypothetical protein MAR_011392, partial [Mya arenaria]